MKVHFGFSSKTNMNSTMFAPAQMTDHFRGWCKKKKMFISHNKPESQWLSSSVLNGPSHCVWQIDARLTTYRRGPHWQCWEQWTLGHLLGMLQNKSIYFLFSFTQLVSCEMNYKMNRNPVDYSVYHNIIQNEYTG